MSGHHQTRREFLQAVGAGAAAALAGAGVLRAAGEAKRPNVLWLISEDTCPDMACYGGQLVATPNIDRLAGEGARFTHAFVTCPVCSPARSAFMTGMYQTTIGAHQHRTGNKQPLGEPVKLLGEYFRRAGYFVSNAAGLNTKRLGKTDWNFKPPDKPFDGTDYSQRKAGQPFFAQYNFSMTHRNFARDTERPIDADKVKVPPYYPDHPVSRRDWADYLESIQVLDSQIGQMLDRLAKDGLADNTIVFYFGDNGRPHVRGKQWLYEGGIHVPLMVRWPGHIQPGQVIDEMVSSIDFGPTAMSLAGLELPGHLQGQPLLGPAAKKREFIVAARDRCDETADRIRCIRTRRYKYIRNFHPDRPYTQFNAYKKRQYPVLTLLEVLHKQGKLTADQEHFLAATRPPEELYDLQADPHELHNLAADAKCQDVLKDLRAKLDAWIKQTGDKGEIPEPGDPAEMLRNGREKFAGYLKQIGLPADATDEQYLEWWTHRLLSPAGAGRKGAGR